LLIDKFRYMPEQNWKKKLSDQILQSGKNVSINFSNTDVHSQITLWSEKKLANGKRPDFMLDVSIRSSTDDSIRGHRLVMDAKFYENINENHHGGISKVIKEMYEKNDNKPKQYRDYSENNKNSVFILHPSENSVPKMKTPQSWAANSFYGENQMFVWDEYMREKYNHKYGAVLLSPMMSGNYLDDLQRLIGMFLQYGIENNSLSLNDKNEIDPDTKGIKFCLVCGSSDCTISKKHTLSNKGYKYWITCNQCHHFTTYSYCSGCRNRLIKHGQYWTYHATKALEPFNIKCPSCASLV